MPPGSRVLTVELKIAVPGLVVKQAQKVVALMTNVNKALTFPLTDQVPGGVAWHDGQDAHLVVAIAAMVVFLPLMFISINDLMEKYHRRCRP